MKERRKHSRANVDLPVTVRLSHQHIVRAKMVELSMDGMRFLCPIAPEVNSEVELRFNLPSEHTHELGLMAKVMHSFVMLATPDTPSNYRYVVGVSFMNPRENERIMLDNFLTDNHF